MIENLHKIVEKKIVFGEIIDVDFYPTCFYEKWVYGVSRSDNKKHYLNVRVLYVSG
jgi:hypothetical protein